MRFLDGTWHHINMLIALLCCARHFDGDIEMREYDPEAFQISEVLRLTPDLCVAMFQRRHFTTLISETHQRCREELLSRHCRRLVGFCLQEHTERK